MRHITSLQKTLTFLDVSYAKKVTDEGCKHFEGKSMNMISIFVNGLSNISSVGLNMIVGSCVETLVELEAALMDQPEMKNDFFANLAKCYNLELLDLTGNSSIDDMGF